MSYDITFSNINNKIAYFQPTLTLIIIYGNYDEIYENNIKVFVFV
jgi:hypothetical protein